MIQPLRSFGDKSLKGKICLSPFNTVHINVAGDVHICPCPAWQPQQVGNIFRQTLDEILSSPAAVAIRSSIIDGSYRHCNEKQCALIINDQLNDHSNTPPEVAKQLDDPTLYQHPTTIAFNIDRVCNLSCPSCRTSVIKNTEEQIAKQQQIVDTVVANLVPKQSDCDLEFITSGAGEVFASNMIMSVLQQLSLDKLPKLRLNLHTNGLLAPSKWHQIQHIESAVSLITVSIDASTANTYQQVRRGGHWPDLIAAMKFLQNKKQKLGFELRTRMIVQQRNYTEAEDFYRLCQEFDVDRVEYSRLDNWNTWSWQEFLQHDVLNLGHPERPQALQVMSTVKTLPNTWFEGNFS
jgi:MoaA/NifB/PqqE/SkfB family radical SAM enzyme